MADEGVQLVDHVLPEVPYRQWVLTFPFGLRFRLAWDQPLRAAVLKVFTAEIEKFYQRCLDLPDAKVGGISVLHRFDSALKIDVHWHLLYADGVWTKSGEDPPVFHPLGKLQPEDVPHVLQSITVRTHKLLKRRGLFRNDLDDNNEAPTDEFAAKEPAMAAILKSSLFDLTLFGPAQKPERERGPNPAVVQLRSRNCANLAQFSLHANTSIAACNRDRLEKMIRYLCRPPVATERVELINGDREVRLRLKSAWRDGTTHIRLSGPDFVLRLIALIPAPRRALLHYHGVLAPASLWRSEIVKDTPRPRVKKPAQTDTAETESTDEAEEELTCGHDKTPEPVATLATKPSRMPWSELMRRIFLQDVLHCEKCGGRRKLIAAIGEGEIAVKILAHLKLPIEAEGFLPIRAPPWDDFGWAYAANDDDAADDDWPIDLPDDDAAA
jgi:hypothetical protein